MDVTLNSGNEQQQAPINGNTSNKSDLMQFFENHVNDMYWAYKDLLKAIFEAKD